MEDTAECIADCTKHHIRLCGKNYDFIVEFQASYKKKNRRHLSIEKAILLIITQARLKSK